MNAGHLKAKGEVIGDSWKLHSWYCTPDSIRRKNRAYGMRGIGWKCTYSLAVKREMKRPLRKSRYILQNCIQMWLESVKYIRLVEDRDL